MTSLLVRRTTQPQVSASERLWQDLLERQSGQMPFRAWLPWRGPGKTVDTVDSGHTEGSGPPQLMKWGRVGGGWENGLEVTMRREPRDPASCLPERAAEAAGSFRDSQASLRPKRLREYSGKRINN